MQYCSNSNALAMELLPSCTKPSIWRLADSYLQAWSFWKQFHSGHFAYNVHHCAEVLTHWGRVTHICVGDLTIIGSDNGLSSGRRQAIIWTNAGILLIGPLRTNFNEIIFEIQKFSFEKMHMKRSAKRQPFCLGLNVLTHWSLDKMSAILNTKFSIVFHNWNYF